MTLISHYLKATNFGFSIPTGATINGIEVEIEKKASSTGKDRVRDNLVYIIKGGTIQTTENKADTVTDWPLVEAYVTYGGLADLWSISWTANDINNIGFGAAISVAILAPFTTVTASIDNIRITVDYTGGTQTTTNYMDARRHFRERIRKY